MSRIANYNDISQSYDRKMYQGNKNVIIVIGSFFRDNGDANNVKLIICRILPLLKIKGILT